MSGYETKKIFSENLSRLLSKNNITQLELAKRMSVAPSSVSSWCNGEKMPRMDKVEWMAEFFGVPVTHLIDQYDPAFTPSDILDEVDIAFYDDYKVLTEEHKDTLRAMARLFRERQDKQE